MDTSEDILVTPDGFELVRARTIFPATIEKPEQVTQAVAASDKKVIGWVNSNNPDLVYVKFILDTEGPNKNRDYQPRTTLLDSYKTAVNKPMDWEHIVKEQGSLVRGSKENPPARNTVFGVMVHSALANSDGELLTEEQIKEIDRTDDMSRPLKDRIAVVGWACLWRYIFPQTVKDILDKAENGNLYVSMERWLLDFDYLIEQEGKTRSVTRADAKTMGLDEKWKKKENYLGRPILRRTNKCVYGGVASTANPANPACKYLELTTEAPAPVSAKATDFESLKSVYDEVTRLLDVSTSESTGRLQGIRDDLLSKLIGTKKGE